MKQPVITYEGQASFLKPERQWFALLECGHRVKVDGPMGHPHVVDCLECDAEDREAA
jgi:hypothetical protein